VPISREQFSTDLESPTMERKREYFTYKGVRNKERVLRV
jgi:hypothetical protein